MIRQLYVLTYFKFQAIFGIILKELTPVNLSANMLWCLLSSLQNISYLASTLSLAKIVGKCPKILKGDVSNTVFYYETVRFF